MKDKDGNIPSTEIEYCRGLESKVKSPSGKVTNYGYDFNTDNLLSLSSEVDGVSHVNRFKYKRNLLESLEHDGFKVGYTYDKEGRRTSTSVNDEVYITTEYNDNYTLGKVNVDPFLYMEYIGIETITLDEELTLEVGERKRRTYVEGGRH